MLGYFISRYHFSFKLYTSGDNTKLKGVKQKEGESLDKSSNIIEKGECHPSDNYYLCVDIVYILSH